MANAKLLTSRRSSRIEAERFSVLPRDFSSCPCPPVLGDDEHDDEEQDQDDEDDHDDDREDAGRQGEVAQMRDDENIGSISKFYFGASAERRSYTQHTTRHAHASSPRARNFTRS